MKKPNISNLVKTVQSSVNKNSPKILLAVGIAGAVITVVTAVKATPKAMKMIDEAKEKKQDEMAEEEEALTPATMIDLTPVEVVKATWKCYIPTIGFGLLSVGCLVASASVNSKRTAALVTAYELSKTALSEYKDAVIETIGEKKAEEVRDKVAENAIAKNPVSQNQIIVTDKGDTLCYDTISGRYFKSDIEKIKKAENELNLELRNRDYASLNTFYDMLGLEHIGIGGEIGWNINADGYIDVRLSAQIADNGTPCIVLDYSEAPKYDYDRFGY